MKFEFDRKIVTDAAKVDAALSDRIEAAAKVAGIPVRRLASGAGHDAAVIGNSGGHDFRCQSERLAQPV